MPVTGRQGLVGAHAYTTATFTVTASTWTAIAFGAERFDTHNMHDNSTNNSRITCVIPGYYQVSGASRVGIDASAGLGSWYIETRKNGTPLHQISSPYNTNAAAHIPAVISVSSIVQLAAGDYVELYTFYPYSTLGSLALGSNADDGLSYLSAVLIGT